MTDNEILQALECCTSKMQCFDCPRFDGNWGMRAFTHCDTKLKSDALDLINRQKAEIENLRTQLFIRNSVGVRKIKIPEGEPYGHNDPVGEKGTMGEVGIGQKWSENDDR